MVGAIRASAVIISLSFNVWDDFIVISPPIGTGICQIRRRNLCLFLRRLALQPDFRAMSGETACDDAACGYTSCGYTACSYIACSYIAYGYTACGYALCQFRLDR